MLSSIMDAANAGIKKVPHFTPPTAETNWKRFAPMVGWAAVILYGLSIQSWKLLHQTDC